MAKRRDPLAMLLNIADRFYTSAEELDRKVERAVEQNAAAHDIRLLVDMANSDRMRAASACQMALPYCHPKLSSVEITPAPPVSKSSFEQRLEQMSETEVLSHLKAITDGTVTITLDDEEPADGD